MKTRGSTAGITFESSSLDKASRNFVKTYLCYLDGVTRIKFGAVELDKT